MKNRNTRVSNTRQRKQQHLLEVTIRRDIAVRQRNRAILFFTLKIVLLLGVLVGLYIGGKEGLRRFVWENPDLVLTDVRVVTDGALTREQIVTASTIIEGKNILTIDLTKAREALDQLPQVERAEIQRTLPNRIDINVTERRPIAWVTGRADEDPTTSEKSFLIDARGIVMRSKVMLPEYLHLPVISGVEVENLAPGQRVQSFEMQAALDLVRLNSDSTRWQARNIDVSKGYCLTVTDRTHAQITFGLDRVDQQLERLNRLLDKVEPTHRELQTVNLLVERNMPVTFYEPGANVEEPQTLPPAPKAEPAPVKAATSKDKPAATTKAAPTPTKSAAAKASPTPSKKSDSSTPKPNKNATPSSRKAPADGVRNPFRLNG